MMLCGVSANSANCNERLLLSLLLFFAFFAFRVGFTPDYYNYEMLFEKYHPQTFLDDRAAQEMGFQFLCQILPSFRMLIIAFTGLYCICLYVAMKHFVGFKYYWLVWFILFCYPPFVLGNMSGLRSGIVTCLFFLSVLVRYKYGFIKGIALALGIMAIAYSIHRSAALLVPLLFLTSKPLNKYVIYGVYAIAAVFIFISILFPNILNDVGYYLTVTWFGDFNYENQFSSELSNEVGLFSIIKSLILVYLLYTTLRLSQKEPDRLNNIILKLTAFFYLLTLAPSSIGLIVRFYYYFAFLCIIGSAIVVKQAKKEERIYYIACIVLYAYWQLTYFYRGTTVVNHYAHYDTILF